MSQPQPAYSAPNPLNESDARLWASLSVFGNILGLLPALLIFLILKDRSQLVREQSKEALNWIITVAIGFVALAVLGGILGALANLDYVGVVFGLLSVLVGIAYFVLYVVNIVFSIIGGIKVTQGGTYRYPFALRLIK